MKLLHNMICVSNSLFVHLPIHGSLDGQFLMMVMIVGDWIEERTNRDRDNKGLVTYLYKNEAGVGCILHNQIPAF